MRNYRAVEDVSRHLEHVCKGIQTLSCSMEMFEYGNADMYSTYETLLYDKLEHIQMLTLKLTELITSAEHQDSSGAKMDEGEGAFMAGELDHVKSGEVDEPVLT